jgi:hypothetical protein
MTDETHVGYKRPPKDTQVKPGTSGYPRGRKKGSRNLRTDLTQMLRQLIAIREDGKRKRITRQQAMLLSLFEKGRCWRYREMQRVANQALEPHFCEFEKVVGLDPSAPPPRSSRSGRGGDHNNRKDVRRDRLATLISKWSINDIKFMRLREILGV